MNTMTTIYKDEKMETKINSNHILNLMDKGILGNKTKEYLHNLGFDIRLNKERNKHEISLFRVFKNETR